MRVANGLTCHDCNVKEGEIHNFGCDMETCPFCGKQLISCDCCYEKLNIDVSPGTWAYRHGLTKKQENKWLKMLEHKGRIPYLSIPNLCRLCGKLWPGMFKADDWKFYVIPELQNEILCENCFNHLKELFPKGWKTKLIANRMEVKNENNK